MVYNESCYYNLTHPQKRIWYIDKVNLNSPLHNIGGCLKINEGIDVDKLKETLNLIIKINEGLRFRFTEKDGQLVQYVSDFKKENIDFRDFSNYEMPKAEHQKWAESVFKRNFQLEGNKLYYFAIYQISENEYGVLLSIHHIICDGWSISLIQKQICEIYSKLAKNETIYFEESYSYLDFIKDEKEYLNSDRFIKNKNFWNEKFNSVPEEFLYKTSNTLKGKRKSINIDSDLSREIKRFVEEKKCSLNTFFIASLLIYINKTTYKKDLVIGTPVFNRVGKKQKSMIGMFTSTVPFKFTLDNKLYIENLIRSINRELKLCLFNQKYPYDLLIKDLEIGKEGYDSLFKMSVNYYNSKYANDIDGIDVEVQEYYSGYQGNSLQLIVKEWEDNNITLSFDYKISEYSDEQIQAMCNSMINIIKSILRNESIKIKNIKLLSKEELNYKTYELNSTNNNYPNKTVYELFEEQAVKTPNKVVLEFKEKRLTYKELNEKSNQLANHLREKGIYKNSTVGIMETHSIELIISILGVLKAGGTYLPIDPSYPIERINYMLQDSKSFMLLTNFEVNDEIQFRGNITNIKDVDLNLYSKENLTQIGGLNDLVYVIYTSGSTGKPKGVMIEHQGLTNYIWWAKKMYLKDENEVMALYSSISFDLTVTSIFTPLISGNKIVIYDTDETEFVLYKILRENKATVVKLTPAHLTLLKDNDNSSSNIKRFIVGGEDLKVNLAKEIYNSFGKNIEIYNEYGPTETVVGCMIYKYDEEKDKSVSVPIGHSADNVQVYILDNDFNVVPTGVVGELYISGDGVARGYLNREELTVRKFIENPFIKKRKMYRTGDTARYLENGAIEYVGRIDNQIKIRGHRIELGEIEKYLLENEYINEAVVAFKEDQLGNKLLNAYVVSKIEITNLKLKSWLLKFLPKYMIPTNFVFVNKFPLTLNGKVNYALLPEPEIAERKFIKYKTLSEEELVKAMEEILGVEDISMNDNYYQLGGDSIKAIQISSKLKNVGLNIKVKDILAYDSIKEIAASIEAISEDKNINQDIASGNFRKTPIIEWFFQQNFIERNHYNQSVLLECKSPLDIESITQAIKILLKHHDSLRINYDKKEDVLFYNNAYIEHNTTVVCIDLSNYTRYEQDKRIKELGFKLKSSFNIEKDILFKSCIFNLGKRGQVVLLTAHHLIIDGVSWRIILDDFTHILKQINNNKEVELPLKTNSFMEWSKELCEYSKKNLDLEKKYWMPILERNFYFPIDFHKGKDLISESAVIDANVEEEIVRELLHSVHDKYRMDLNEILITALAMSISDITNEEYVVMEVEGHGREIISDEINITRTVGWFTSLFPVQLRVLNENIDYNIKYLKEQIRNIPNKGFDFGIVKYLNNELNKNNNKYIRFNYLGEFDNISNNEIFEVIKLDGEADIGYNNQLTAILDITAMILDKKLKINIVYSMNKFKEETVQNFLNKYVNKLKEIVEFCDSKPNIEFTPSDFVAVDISQEDLDSLFI